PRQAFPAGLTGGYKPYLPSGRSVPRSAGGLAGVLVPPSPERVVDDRHGDSPHPRVRPAGCLHGVESWTRPHERLLEPSSARYLTDRRPAHLVDQYALPRWSP